MQVRIGAVEMKKMYLYVTVALQIRNDIEIVSPALCRATRDATLCCMYYRRYLVGRLVGLPMGSCDNHAPNDHQP